MKRMWLTSLLCLLAAWGMAQAQQPDAYVEVLYFHGKQRCATCKALEKCTKEVVTKDLAGWMKEGKLRFKEVDISTAEGEKVADAYRVTWSSLYVNLWKQGREERHDLTRMGFQYARSKPDYFKQELKKTITALLDK